MPVLSHMSGTQGPQLQVGDTTTRRTFPRTPWLRTSHLRRLFPTGIKVSEARPRLRGSGGWTAEPSSHTVPTPTNGPNGPVWVPCVGQSLGCISTDFRGGQEHSLHPWCVTGTQASVVLPEAKAGLQGLRLTALPERAGCWGWGGRVLPWALHGHHAEEARVQGSPREGIPHPRRPRSPHGAVRSPLGATLSLPVPPSRFPWAWWASPLSFLPTSRPPTSSRHDLPFFQPCWPLVSPQTGFLLRRACPAFFSSALSPSPHF